MSYKSQPNYLQDLKGQLKRFHEAATNKREQLKTITDNQEWFKNRSELNSIEADIVIIQSRIDNMRQPKYMPDNIEIIK